MRVTMLTGKTEENSNGGTTSYKAGLTFEVDSFLAETWIREGAAEDETGKVSRVDLLSHEEAVEAGLVDPVSTVEADPEPEPEFDPVAEPEPEPEPAPEFEATDDEEDEG